MNPRVRIIDENPRETIKRSFEKIVVNAGIGRMLREPHFEDKGFVEIKKELGALTGQAPQVRRLRKSLAGFTAREGEPVGLRITLRGAKMVDFFLRLVRIVMPRVRDFRGIDISNIDAQGVLNLGIREQSVFPEINAEESRTAFSLGVNIVPKKKNRDLTIELYRSLGVPLRSESQKKSGTK